MYSGEEPAHSDAPMMLPVHSCPDKYKRREGRGAGETHAPGAVTASEEGRIRLGRQKERSPVVDGQGAIPTVYTNPTAGVGRKKRRRHSQQTREEGGQQGARWGSTLREGGGLGGVFDKKGEMLEQGV